MIKKRFVNRVVADDNLTDDPRFRGGFGAAIGAPLGGIVGYGLAKATDLGKGFVSKALPDFEKASRRAKIRTAAITAVPAVGVGAGMGYMKYLEARDKKRLLDRGIDITAADNNTDWGKAAAIGAGTAAGYGTSLHTDVGRELLFKAKPFKEAAEHSAGIRQLTPEELVKNYKRMEALGDLRKTALIGAGAAAGAGLYYGGKKLYNRNNNITSADKGTYDDNHIDRLVKNGAIGGAITGALGGATGSALIGTTALTGAAVGGGAGWFGGNAGKLAGVKHGKFIGSGVGTLLGHGIGNKIGQKLFGRHLARDMAIGAAAGTTMGALGGALAGKQKEANPENSDTGAMIKGPLKYGATVGTAAGTIGGGILGHNLPKLGKVVRYGGIPLAGAAIGAGLGAAGGELVGLHQVPANAIGRFITKDRGQNVNNTVTSADENNHYDRYLKNGAIGGAVIGSGLGLASAAGAAKWRGLPLGAAGAIAGLAGGAATGATGGVLTGLAGAHYKERNPESSDVGAMVKGNSKWGAGLGAGLGLIGGTGATLLDKAHFPGAKKLLLPVGGAIGGAVAGGIGGAMGGLSNAPAQAIGKAITGDRGNSITSSEVPLIHVIALSKEDKRNAGIATGATLGLGAGGYLGYKGLSGLAESNALKDIEKSKNTYGDIWAGRKAGLKGLFTKGVKSKDAYKQALLENKTARLLSKNAEKIGKWGKMGAGLGAVGLGTTGAYAGYKVTSSEVPLINIVAINIVDMAAKKAYVPGKMTKTWGNISSNVGNWTPDVHIAHSVARKQIPEAELVGAMHSAATRQHQNYLANNIGKSDATDTANKLYNKVLEYSKKSDTFNDVDRQLYNNGSDFVQSIYKKQAKANAPKTGTGVIVHPTQTNLSPEYTKAQQRMNAQSMKKELRDRTKQNTLPVPKNKIETVQGGFIDPALARAQQKINNQKLKTEFRRNMATQNVPVNTVPKIEPVGLDTADTRSWVRKHPYKTAAIAGAGVGAAGTGAYIYNKNRQNNG